MEKIEKIVKSKCKDSYSKDKWKFIKDDFIYVPYRNPHFDCLIQDITRLNIFFSSVMKLVEMNIIKIEKIQEILGLDIIVLNEVLVDLVQAKLIHTRENKVFLTRSGYKALEEDKQVIQYKYSLNRIAVNTLTGEIICNDNIKFENYPDRNCPTLNEQIVVNEKFLKTHFTDLNTIYNIIQENDNVFGYHSITKELYKIIGIVRDFLRYLKIRYKVYLNIDTNDIEVRFDDKDESVYSEIFFKQINQNYPSLECFFERDYAFTRNIKNNLNILENEQYVCKCDFKHKRSQYSPSEYLVYFTDNKDFEFDWLLIESENYSYYFSKVLRDITTLSNFKKIVVRYTAKDWSWAWFKKELLKYGNKENIIFELLEGVQSTTALFYPYTEIHLLKKGILYSNKVISYVEAEMLFELNLVNDEMDYLKGNKK